MNPELKTYAVIIDYTAIDKQSGSTVRRITTFNPLTAIVHALLTLDPWPADHVTGIRVQRED